MTAAMELGWAYAGIKSNLERIQQIYLTEPITLLDTMQKQKRLTLRDVQEDPQYIFFKRFYQTKESPEDYARFLVDIYRYKSEGALTIGIDSLLTKEKNKDFGDSR